jgi:hypothetical protein
MLGGNAIKMAKELVLGYPVHPEGGELRRGEVHLLKTTINAPMDFNFQS